eukprot:PRCOL_00002724-RA
MRARLFGWRPTAAALAAVRLFALLAAAAAAADADAAASGGGGPGAAPAASAAAAPSVVAGRATMFVGLMSTCCDAEGYERRALQRAILRDYFDFDAQQREKLLAGAAGGGTGVSESPRTHYEDFVAHQWAPGLPPSVLAVDGARDVRELPPLRGQVDMRFVVGHPPGDRAYEGVANEAAVRELRHADDLLKLDVEESYHNLYLKTDLMILWALAHTRAELILKVDDDAYVNWANAHIYFSMFAISQQQWDRAYAQGERATEQLEQGGGSGLSRGTEEGDGDGKAIFAGALESKWGFIPIRKPGHKWSLTEDEWPDTCPHTRYAAGWSYLLSRDAAFQVARALWRGPASGGPLPDEFASSVDDIAGWVRAAGLLGHPSPKEFDAGNPDYFANATDLQDKCSLRRLWFEDTRVGIALAAATDRKMGASRLRNFNAAFECCSRWMIAKHLNNGCDAPASMVLPVVHQDMKRAMGRPSHLSGRVACMYGVPICGRYGLWSRMRKFKEAIPGHCRRMCFPHTDSTTGLKSIHCNTSGIT